MSIQSSFSPSRYGQASLEFLMIVVIGALLLTPVFIILSDQTATLDDTNRNLQVSNSLNTLLESGKIIHAQGPPSKMLVTLKFPNNVVNYSIANQEITFYILQEGIVSSIVEAVDFNVTGNISVEEGIHKVTVESFDNGSSVWVGYYEYEE